MRTRSLLLFACSLVFAQPDANPQQMPPQTNPASQQQNYSPVMYGTYVQYNEAPPAAIPDSIAKREAAIKDSIAAERAKEDSLKNVVWYQMESSSLFAGFHISFGLAGIYNSEKVKGRYTPGSKSENYADPFKGTIGFTFDLGLAGMYRPIKYAGLYLEADFRLSYYSRESDDYCIDVQKFGKTKCEALDEDILLIGFDFPLLLRVYPTRNFFLEAGPSLRLNVYGSRSLSEDTDWSISTDDDENKKNDSYREDLGGWDCETAGYSLVFGFGYTTVAMSETTTLTGGTKVSPVPVELAFRVIVDQTNLEEQDAVQLNKKYGTYREASTARSWSINLSFTVFGGVW
ncbi:hypothetical protein [Fibrobacter sp.]|uniref:hypothetical protein n=1 Tax=Fibrobacter sp. TaxID=35828 RepID=UPI002637C9C8|nr:hypothetical protein [Fibrobacter sp.]MDD5943575.1 hypothetical protein [Fibrobacter sp.]